MAQPRRWDRLAASTQRRYLSAGRKQGLTPQQIQQHYESGGSVSAWRGHRQHAGASERQWRKLKAAAKRAELDKDVDNPGDVDNILESLLSKGLTVDFILQKLGEKHDSRTIYRSWLKRRQRNERPFDDAGYNPGRQRYNGRVTHADIELYYYH